MLIDKIQASLTGSVKAQILDDWINSKSFLLTQMKTKLNNP